MTFHNIRIEQDFERVSAQMIRLLDKVNIPSYEYVAF